MKSGLRSGADTVVRSEGLLEVVKTLMMLAPSASRCAHYPDTGRRRGGEVEGCGSSKAAGTIQGRRQRRATARVALGSTAAAGPFPRQDGVSAGSGPACRSTTLASSSSAPRVPATSDTGRREHPVLRLRSPMRRSTTRADDSPASTGAIRSTARPDSVPHRRHRQGADVGIDI